MEISSLDPVAAIGEMGFFTGPPRSGMVKVAEMSTFLVLKNASFGRPMRKMSVMSRLGYRGIKQRRSDPAGALCGEPRSTGSC